MAGHPQSHFRRRFRIIVRAVLITVVLAPLLYILVAFIGAIVPRNADWREPEDGIQIFVQTNGVHVDLVLPVAVEGHDLSRLLPPDHIARPDVARGWASIGWGQREFYLETPRWSDLTARNALRAVAGGDVLMHVTHGARPDIAADTRPVRLDPEGYARLIAFVKRGFAQGKDGRPIPLPGTGYTYNDTFYEGRGRYSALRTSNQWTADALAHAGVRIGIWTPFAQSIMWRFDAR